MPFTIHPASEVSGRKWIFAGIPVTEELRQKFLPGSGNSLYLMQCKIQQFGFTMC